MLGCELEHSTPMPKECLKQVETRHVRTLIEDKQP